MQTLSHYNHFGFKVLGIVGSSLFACQPIPHITAEEWSPDLWKINPDMIVHPVNPVASPWLFVSADRLPCPQNTWRDLHNLLNRILPKKLVLKLSPYPLQIDSNTDTFHVQRDPILRDHTGIDDRLRISCTIYLAHHDPSQSLRPIIFLHKPSIFDSRLHFPRTATAQFSKENPKVESVKSPWMVSTIWVLGYTPWLQKCIADV